ncbi:uncharacterized protein LOC123539936 [Mercenaria mercenaria]|uniref:uncharacterized protein LOC123539936 n=1 Tax=Mercenaria mercenaria TaxID=6596 RepID=UPI00234F55AB|nr:uncharacterized protein LOC123539936 [Mercenaria mercenaria]
MAKALSVPSVEHFNMTGDPSSLPSKWERWLKSFQYFVVGSGVTDKSQKRALLLHLVGPGVQGIFETLDNTGNDNNFDAAADALNNYFKPKLNVSYERHKFNSEKQKQNETIQDFATRLKQLSISCDFNDTNDRIRDQIIEKCTSTTLRRKFLSNKDLTLEKVLELSSTFERAQDSATKMENQSTQQQQKDDTTFQLKQSTMRQRQQRANRGRGRFRQQAPPTHVECYSCGRRGHMAKDPNCPAARAACTKCGFIGHFAVKCKSKRKKIQPKQKVRSLENETSSDSENEYLFNIKSIGNVSNKITVNVGNIPLNMVIDSGASCNIVDKSTWNFLKSQKQFQCLTHKKSTDKKVFAYGSKQPLKLLGIFRAKIEFNSMTIDDVEFSVLDGKGQALLSKDTSISLNVLRIGPVVNLVKEDIMSENPELFKGIGKMKDFQLQIPIDEKIEPVVQSVRRIPFSLREKLEKKLLELENNDIIERVNSPSRWVSPVVVVPKGDDDIRLVIDMRRSNTAVKRVRHPIPTVDEVLYDLNGSTVYSKLDISNAYHQLELHPDSREITTFITHVGMFRYKRLLQGVSCASEMFQKVLEQVLQNCPGTRNIMDDIIVHAPTKDEHQKCLENVLRVLHEKGFTLNPSKCQFEMSKVTFMGNVLSEHGVGPTESKVRDVLNARAPRNAAEVRSFLGLVNFNASSTSATPISVNKKRELSSPLDDAEQKKSKTCEPQHIVLSSEDIIAISNALKGTLREEFKLEQQNQVQAIVNGVLAGLNAKIQNLETENAVLRARVDQLEQKADDAEQYSRRNCLRIRGVPEEGLSIITESMQGKPEATNDELSSENGDDVTVQNKDESTDSKVRQLASVMEVNFETSDIDRSHRIGQKTPGKPRDIIVKFVSYRAKNAFYRARFNLRSCGFPGVFINEDLTKARSSLFYKARQLLRDRFLAGAWTYDGAVVVKDANRKIHRVNSEAELMKIKSPTPIRWG